jgi:hypothetical protein
VALAVSTLAGPRADAPATRGSSSVRAACQICGVLRNTAPSHWPSATATASATAAASSAPSHHDWRHTANPSHRSTRIASPCYFAIYKYFPCSCSGFYIYVRKGKTRTRHLLAKLGPRSGQGLYSQLGPRPGLGPRASLRAPTLNWEPSVTIHSGCHCHCHCQWLAQAI